MIKLYIKNYTVLHVKCPLFLSDFNESNFLERFSKNSQISNFYENPSSGNHVVPWGRTDNMTKLIVAPHNFERAQKATVFLYDIQQNLTLQSFEINCSK